jgi:hypothetical protein
MSEEVNGEAAAASFDVSMRIVLAVTSVASRAS